MKSLKNFIREQFKEFKENFYKDIEKTRIAIEITYYREKRGLTQKELAKLLGTSQSTIARLENPFYDKHSLKTLRKYKKLLLSL